MLQTLCKHRSPSSTCLSVTRPRFGPTRPPKTRSNQPQRLHLCRKYLRAVSRLTALARAAETPLASG